MSEDKNYGHKPVLIDEVTKILVTDLGGLYLDATLGLGGHSAALLNEIAPRGGKLLGIEWDPEAFAIARERLKTYGSAFQGECGNYRRLATIAEAKNFFPLTGALFDLGANSIHFDRPERGFSFNADGPLDMRFSPENPLTAEAIVNAWPEHQLSTLFQEFGEEPLAGSIAHSIIKRRVDKPFHTTKDLAEHVVAGLPRALAIKAHIHPATRVFMALRIAVNRELENLTDGLKSAVGLLRGGGRIAVISFHSLEDRIVKNAFASFVAQGSCRYIADKGISKVIYPSSQEVEKNARARSAKLRCVERIWPS